MKKILAIIISILASSSWSATLIPIQLLGPSGCSSGQVVTSTGLGFICATSAAPVTSVAGRTGAITLNVSDVSGAAALISPAFTTPALGTPSSGIATNLTGTASALNIGGTSGTANNLSAGASGSVPYQTSSGVTTFLAAGSNTQVLTLSGGLPTWSTPASGGMTNPMTTLGDSIIGGTSGTPTRLPIGSSGQILTVVSGSPVWVAEPYNPASVAITGGTISGATIGGNTITTGTGTLTIAAAKTLTANNSLTLSGTDATTMTFPTTSASVARTDAAQTFTGTQTFGIGQYGAGSAAAPSISFSARTNAGFYTIGTDSISFSLAATPQFRTTVSSWRFVSGLVFGWSSGNADSTSMDTAFSRTAAGVLALGNGTGSDVTGVLKLSSISHTKQDVDLSYTYNQPTTGTTVTLATGTQTAIIDPAGTLATLTITLPACTVGYDGSIARYGSSQAVTVLTVNATSGSVVGGPTSLALGQGSGYICRGSNTTWYRLY